MCLYTHTYVIFQWRIPNICIGSSTIDNKWNVFQSHSFHLHTLFPFDMFPSIFNHLHSIINHNKLLLFYLGFSHSSFFSAPWQISYGIQENYITQRKTQALNKHYSKYLLVFTVIKIEDRFYLQFALGKDSKVFPDSEMCASSVVPFVSKLQSHFFLSTFSQPAPSFFTAHVFPNVPIRPTPSGMVDNPMSCASFGLLLQSITVHLSHCYIEI